MDPQDESGRAEGDSGRPRSNGDDRLLASPAIEPLGAKLHRLVPLTDADLALLGDLAETEAWFGAQTEVAHEGDGPPLLLVCEGLVCQQRIAPDGRRQILDFLLPGDLCDQHLVLAASADYSVVTLSSARVTFLSKPRLIDLLSRSRRLAAAFRWCALQKEAVLRERIVALGRRKAPSRIAYILCELYWRHEALGLTDAAGTVRASLTQTALADAVGLTPVHVSRVLGRFRAQKIVDLSRTRLRVIDLERLRAIAWLDPSYLHFEGPSDVAMRLVGGTAAEPRGFPLAQPVDGAPTLPTRPPMPRP